MNHQEPPAAADTGAEGIPDRPGGWDLLAPFAAVAPVKWRQHAVEFPE
jgi:hypothetical protein